MLRTALRHALSARQSLIVSRTASTLSRATAPRILSCRATPTWQQQRIRTYAAVIDRPPTPRRELEETEVDEQEIDEDVSSSPIEHLNHLAELSVMLHQWDPPESHTEKLQVVQQIIQNIQLYLMTHMRHPSPSESNEAGEIDVEASTEYYTSLVGEAVTPFSHVFRLRQVILSMHQAAISLVKSIPPEAWNELDLDLGYDIENPPSLKGAVDHLVSLEQSVEDAWEWLQISAIRFRLLNPEQAAEIDVAPINVVPDSQQAELEKRRQDPQYDPSKLDEMTASESQEFLSETEEMADPEAFLQHWTPLFAELSFSDEVLSIFLAAQNDPSIPADQLREQLGHIIQSREEYLEELMGDLTEEEQERLESVLEGLESQSEELQAEKEVREPEPVSDGQVRSRKPRELVIEDAVEKKGN